MFFLYLFLVGKVNRFKPVSKWTVGRQVLKREQLEFRDALGILGLRPRDKAAMLGVKTKNLHENRL